MEEENIDFINIDCVGCKLIDSDVLKIDDYVLVKFKKGKKDIFYAGKVKDVENNSNENGDAFVVSFFRKNRLSSEFYEPEVADCSYVLRNEIELKLPQPTHPPGTSRCATKYLFNIDLSQYNFF